ncbi:MAG: FHA domain-containing protein [Tannerella sp.]|jgi:S1-C subfamily serine protease|nr:FHA domain-containing protein [Tannerella sp.]
MANQATQPYKRSLKGSIGAGMGSLIGGSGKSYYILEHKISSRYHKAGESQEIIVNQIELGRDSKCQVRFDESFGTVSRRHAAIVRDGDMWKLVQVSQTNSTFLNGKKVEKDWYLQNGDEIQLSANGPKLGFIVPSGKKATVGSIGMSRRLSLFRQQALRPYKQAMTALSVALVLLVAGAAYWGLQQDKKREEQAKVIDNQDKDIKKLTDKIDLLEAVDISDLTTVCSPYVYVIYEDKIVITYPGGKVEEVRSRLSETNAKVMGTGFLLDNGKFFTARHVSESWFFYEYVGKQARDLNIIANNGGKVVAHYQAISGSGDRLFFTSDDLYLNNRSDDKTINTGDWIMKKAVLESNDWAGYPAKTSGGGLKYNAALSTTLRVGTELHVLGFPYGRGAENKNNITPIYSKCIVSRDGLDGKNGTIMVSNANTEGGNSGGPVIVKQNGEYQVIGILSGNTYDKDRIVPIASLEK